MCYYIYVWLCTEIVIYWIYSPSQRRCNDKWQNVIFAVRRLNLETRSAIQSEGLPGRGNLILKKLELLLMVYQNQSMYVQDACAQIR